MSVYPEIYGNKKEKMHVHFHKDKEQTVCRNIPHQPGGADLRLIVSFFYNSHFLRSDVPKSPTYEQCIEKLQ